MFPDKSVIDLLPLLSPVPQVQLSHYNENMPNKAYFHLYVKAFQIIQARLSVSISVIWYDLIPARPSVFSAIDVVERLDSFGVVGVQYDYYRKAA